MKCKFLCSSLLIVSGLLGSSSALFAMDPYIHFTPLGPFEIMYIGDLDPAGRGSGATWFGVELYGYENAPTEIILEFTLDSDLIFNGTTNQLYFDDDLPLNFTNIDFSNQHFDYGDQTIDIDDWDFNEDYINDISSSRLASGSYAITITLENTLNGNSISETLYLQVTNPDAVWLMSPNPDQTVTMPTPVFIWSSAAQLFRIRLCRAEDGQLGGEDVMSNQPVWEEELTGNTATYPAGDVPPLQHAATYYWQVFALVNTTSGVIEFPSDIWRFTYNEEDDFLLEETMELLEDLFPGQAGEVLNQLNGYEMSGTIMVDGMPMAAYGLEDFLDGARKGEVEVIDITVE